MRTKEQKDAKFTKMRHIRFQQIKVEEMSSGVNWAVIEL
ncbi:hypothetical protein AciX9_2002 [Granulicella tundricola MP5ACTX9]|uniref:Uncharacterized protein n=1 Tax=Granulicella tundricola (strain ATCC BAA-1859 / DSM 23138 / MP5ACTX9) TaxID=1198114 RepID=E8X193_GRATM|nr:hypothetical protein AciX9_2002 [Granulicella tundricola MP5ACTX9]